jgi:cytochrome c oxidase subunit 2
MTTILIIGIVILLISVVFQVSKTSEMVTMLKGAAQTRKDSTKIIALMFLLFMPIFLIGCFWSAMHFKSSFLPESASVHGVWIDNVFNITLLVTGLVFVLTQVGLFLFVYIYREREGQKALYYPENSKLEMWWTIIPAIFMTVLVVTGLFYWFKITGPAPKDAMVIEVTGKQFNWIARYPGADGKLGYKNFTLINDNNIIGMDTTDVASHDDIIPTDLHFVVGKPVKIIINSRDVMHNFDLPHFRVKMDAVPGIPTTFWFTPKYTTEQMREIVKNPKFNYELACAQICGQSHYAMKMAVKVETQEEFDKWIKGQGSYYQTIRPAAPAIAVVEDTKAEEKKEEKK